MHLAADIIDDRLLAQIMTEPVEVARNERSGLSESGRRQLDRSPAF